MQADRERILLKTGKKKPEAAAATPSSKPAPAKGKKGEEAEEKEKEKKELEPEEKKAEAKAPEKEEKSVATPQQKAPQGPPAAPKPITTKSGLTPLRRYLPGQGLVLPVPGKRAGFGDKYVYNCLFSPSSPQTSPKSHIYGYDEQNFSSS